MGCAAACAARPPYTPELEAMAKKLELHKWPKLPLHELQDEYGARVPKSDNGLLSKRSFKTIVRAQKGWGASLFGLIDLNGSGTIDFLEWLYGAFHLAVLEDDTNVYRSLFQQHAFKGQHDPVAKLKLSGVIEMLVGLHGEEIPEKSYRPLLNKIQSIAAGTIIEWSTFKEAVLSYKSLFMPAFATRDELKTGVFGMDLWEKAVAIRRDAKFNIEDITGKHALGHMKGRVEETKATGEQTEVQTKHAGRIEPRKDSDQERNAVKISGPGGAIMKPKKLPPLTDTAAARRSRKPSDAAPAQAREGGVRLLDSSGGGKTDTGGRTTRARSVGKSADGASPSGRGRAKSIPNQIQEMNASTIKRKARPEAPAHFTPGWA